MCIRDRKYNEGDIIVKANSKIRNLCFVTEGEISVRLLRDDGQTVEMDILRKGNSYGGFSMIKNQV